MMQLCFVGIGGALGAMLRYGLLQSLPLRQPGSFPWAIFSANVLGSFLIGFISIYLASKTTDNPALRLFLMVGLLGGFTTFSSFSLDTVHLIQSGYVFKAMTNIIGTVFLCLLAAMIGMQAGKQIF